MTRVGVNVLWDGVLVVLLLALMWSAAVLHFVFPPASAAAGWTLWGGDYDTWRRVHGAALAVFCLGILLHLILHWGWLCRYLGGKIGRRRGRPVATDEATVTLYGVTVLIACLAILGIFVGVAQFAVRSPMGEKAVLPDLEKAASRL